MASVTLQQLYKKFGDVTAVDKLQIDVADGEFLTLLGPSGCGKSTALYCVAGLERPTSGEILFDGKAVTELEPHERNIAMVFQDYALYPHMSVRDNMGFGLKQQKLDAKLIAQQVDAAGQMLGLGELMHRRPVELSGGQRQRVAVGRAVVRNPTVLLMDEPLSNLDASLRVRTRTEIKRLQRELGTTAIFVTHDQEEAMVLSDRVAVLRQGQLLQIDAPLEVYRNPNNLFVASFIGSPTMNFIAGSLTVADRQLQFTSQGNTISLGLETIREETLRAINVAREVMLGVRPTDLLVAAERELSLTGKVFLVEPIGPITYVDLDIAGYTLKAVVDPDQAPQIGDIVKVGFSSSRVYVFDPASELRL